MSLVVKDSGLELTERETLLGKFSEYENIAEDWEKKAKAIVVTNPEQVAEMKMAREGRLFLAQKRIDVEKTRKALKEQSLRKGQVIDAIAKFLTSLIEPTEKYLKDQEDFVEIQNKKKAEELRLAEEKRLEEERIAKEQAEREEQERIRQENIKLKAEMEAKEKEMAEERAKAEAERLEKERIQKLLDAQIECPYCHRKFNKETL